LFELFGQKTITDIDNEIKSKQQVNSTSTVVSKIENVTTSTHESTFDIDDIKKLWSKMCRLAANLCLEKNSKRIKNLFTSGKYFLVHNKAVF
jgi:hypothetical protein